MKISLLVVGKTTDSLTCQSIDCFTRRLVHYCPFSIDIIPELKKTANLSPDVQKEREADLILRSIDTSDYVVLLDERGTQPTSVQFADRLEKMMNRSPKRIIFIVGGPFGVSKRIADRANEMLALSAMTFTHQLIRLLFVEQLYRAFTIINNEPYHNL